MKPPFFILPFQEHALEIMVRECFGAHYLDIKTKLQAKYLTDYLRRLNVKTLICETNYIDKHYLVDYSQFLVRSHQDFGKTCARVHFFKSNISYNDIDENLKLGHLKCFDDYAGYSVIKPLPKTFFGRTCLPPPKHKRQTAISHTFEANLFGASLSIDSVPYQEQDKIVSACATASLWSLLSTVDNNHNDSPSTLTKMASVENDLRFNEPKTGLKDSQIERVIVKQGLRPYAGNIEYAAQIRSYLDSDIAVLLGVSVIDGVEHNASHAVTVTGYRCNEQDEMVSLLIHDDRIGPYVVFDIHEKTREDKTPYIHLTCDEYLSEQSYEVTRFTVAVNHKVRIPATVIRDTVKKIENAALLTYTLFGKLEEIEAVSRIKWVTKLRKSNALKSEWLEQKASHLKSNLVLSLPRNVWVSTAFIDGNKVFDLVFDATGVEQSNLLLTAVPYNKTILDYYKVLLAYVIEETEIENDADDEDGVFIKALRKLSENTRTHERDLDKAFGLQRLPKIIKDAEADHKGVLQQKEIIRIQFPHAITDELIHDLQELASNNPFLIWIMDADGNIVIGPDSGHPTLINGNAGRIAGEIHYDNRHGPVTLLKLNHKSNRYSSEHYESNKSQYLSNATAKLNAYLSPKGIQAIELNQFVVELAPTLSDKIHFAVLCTLSNDFVSPVYDSYPDAEAALGKSNLAMNTPIQPKDALIRFLGDSIGTANLCVKSSSAKVASLSR